MKNPINFTRMALVALLAGVLAAPVLAQGGRGGGMGGGMGGGPCMQNDGSAQGMMGPGGGMRGQGGRGMRGNSGNAAGWTLMTPEERTAMQIKMRAVKTLDECQTVQTEHRGVMELRAKEKGVTLQMPRQNACERLKARGLIS